MGFSMEKLDFIVCLLRLLIGGVAAFFAIFSWSRSKNIAWRCLASGTVINYAGIVYDMFLTMGVFYDYDTTFLGFPLISIFFSIIPLVFFAIGFFLLALSNR